MSDTFTQTCTIQMNSSIVLLYYHRKLDSRTGRLWRATVPPGPTGPRRGRLNMRSPRRVYPGRERSQGLRTHQSSTGFARTSASKTLAHLLRTWANTTHVSQVVLWQPRVGCPSGRRQRAREARGTARLGVAALGLLSWTTRPLATRRPFSLDSPVAMSHSNYRE
jgi:hypothetical protein